MAHQIKSHQGGLPLPLLMPHAAADHLKAQRAVSAFAFPNPFALMPHLNGRFAHQSAHFSVSSRSKYCAKRSNAEKGHRIENTSPCYVFQVECYSRGDHR